MLDYTRYHGDCWLYRVDDNDWPPLISKIAIIGNWFNEVNFIYKFSRLNCHWNFYSTVCEPVLARWTHVLAVLALNINVLPEWLECKYITISTTDKVKGCSQCLPCYTHLALWLEHCFQENMELLCLMWCCEVSVTSFPWVLYFVRRTIECWIFTVRS